MRVRVSSRLGMSLASLLVVAGCGTSRQRITARDIPLAIDLSSVAEAPETYEDGDLDHLRYILQPPQVATYSALTPDQRREMLRVVWAALDPTPTTERNERREAHYRRLAYARETFRRSGSPPWDKRGELLIRYGSPTRREFVPMEIEPGNVVPPLEIWTYEYPPMSFELGDIGLKDDYEDWHYRIFSSRRDLAYGTGPVDAGSSISGGIEAPNLDVAAAQHQSERLFAQGFHALQDSGGTKQAYLADLGGRKLDYVFDVLDFAGPEPGSTDVDVNLLFDAGQLAFDGGAAELEVDVVAKTPDYREVTRVAHVMREAQRDKGKGLVLDKATLNLPPGDYRLALQVRDAQSGSVGIFTTETTVRRFDRDRLSLSDVQLATSVEEGRPGTRFSKGNVLVTPNPAAVFRRGRLVFLYFEIYGLGAAPGGGFRYNERITIRPRAAGSSTPPSVAMSYDGTSRRGDVPRYFSFSTATLEPGSYEVEVRVMDWATGRVASQTAAFQVRGQTAQTER